MTMVPPPPLPVPLFQLLLSFVQTSLQLTFILLCIIIVFHRGCSFVHRHIRRKKRRKHQHSQHDDGRNSNKNHNNDNTNTKEVVIAFFHPYCTGGGGGERVLWKMIQVLGELISSDDIVDDVDRRPDTKDDSTTRRKHKDDQQHTTFFQTKTTRYHPTIIIYTVDLPTATYVEDVKKHIHDRFGLHLSQSIQLQFVHLHQYTYLLKSVPFLSLLMESFGSMCLAYIGLCRSLYSGSTPTSPQQQQRLLLPDLFIDTTGCVMTYLPATILFGCHVFAYVHYPTISTDMLQLVWERRRTGTYNHQSYIAKSIITTYVKLIYYVLFAVLYGCVGSLSTMVLVNSTWTYNHIASLWKFAAYRKRIRIVYPPCSLPEATTKSNSSNSIEPQQHQNTIDDEKRLPIILSIGQFRPEKDHTLQIEAMAQYLKKYHPTFIKTSQSANETSKDGDTAIDTMVYPQLVLIGSCRHDQQDDQDRLNKLKQLCHKLQISQHVRFVVNQPFAVVQQYLYTSQIGIHTMWNEHFGIGIVEMMAAGLIVIAHNSGGPKSDIVVPLQDFYNTKDSTTTTTGFLATTVDEYSERINYIMSLTSKEVSVIRRNASESSKRFTDDVFSHSFANAMRDIKL